MVLSKNSYLAYRWTASDFADFDSGTLTVINYAEWGNPTWSRLMEVAVAEANPWLFHY